MIPGVIDHGGDDPAGHMRRSRLADYAEMTVPGAEAGRPTGGEGTHSPEPADDDAPRRRREFAALLGEFRRTAVLVPLDRDDAPLAGDHGGVRWIYAFSDEAALARFALARGEGSRERAYRRVLGARLLDAAVPAAGVPCGVALDVGSDGDGMLFPPVPGIVPDTAAVHREEDAEEDGDKGAQPR
ncbi:hypothetical protein [Streptomyces sp. NPDC046197]|uniref:hypothetical protein n=1 Tax=Streptomyces sp. NPDC046197 TaxID=3154337 RepID=UPI0033E16B99